MGGHHLIAGQFRLLCAGPGTFRHCLQHHAKGLNDVFRRLDRSETPPTPTLTLTLTPTWTATVTATVAITPTVER